MAQPHLARLDGFPGVRFWLCTPTMLCAVTSAACMEPEQQLPLPTIYATSLDAYLHAHCACMHAMPCHPTPRRVMRHAILAPHVHVRTCLCRTQIKVVCHRHHDKSKVAVISGAPRPARRPWPRATGCMQFARRLGQSSCARRCLCANSMHCLRSMPAPGRRSLVAGPPHPHLSPVPVPVPARRRQRPRARARRLRGRGDAVRSGVRRRVCIALS